MKGYVPKAYWLDSTVVVEVTDMGHADLHSQDDVPMFIAGGGNAVNRGVTLPYGNLIPSVVV